ncbi:hypothetical protein BO94DRAFT_523427 [Aspergillus sclerotioniger CBS 115572]|uniref:Ima1 N-terminal domain-containing protein n=1 Tax=Aspergillus sclerotioniger CBS 115572 TaxID=1450535 RepID=A0A317VSX3_9EURO|nr:hypothetical protein BO94DRAFT_523427 [Aspergillus sclerotioniger CBS 115572]PWY76411.1 hypothetical protein BO94DRAFT_523427 [Aspergillus sclerotioniger CBS 115572]
MAPLFAKRLKCFYCGRRSALSGGDTARKWCCKHCEAVNYLDEKGEITDPPAAETNPDVYGPGGSSPPFESTDFTASSLFCAQCLRNQHLFTSTLASYFPSSDDPNYGAYEKEYPKFRKNLEERYPQVCVKCEPRVKQRIRQAGYEAKSDHLRRMMDRSKAGRAARQARRWNWRNLLALAGGLGHWISVTGQLGWNVWSALKVEEHEPLQDPDAPSMSPSIVSCVRQVVETRLVPSSCSIDLAPYAGLALIAGILSIWWNPKLRLRVEGRGGRFVGLGEYYQVQLIVMVVRCAFWGVLRDPSSSGLPLDLPPTLHLFMIFFTILSVLVSRRIVRYDTRPLVVWTDDTPAPTPNRRTEASPPPSTSRRQVFSTPNSDLRQRTSRFPLEKLATPRATTPRAALEDTHVLTPPPESDDMDWTPSVQHQIAPTVSVHQRDQKSVLEGPMPFYGSVPPAPQPPAWNLRNQPAQRPKPIEQVVERNPFHRTPTQSSPWQRNPNNSDTVFAPPKFFPLSDHAATTGLESLFDRTFTIKSPEDEEDTTWQARHQTSNSRSRDSTDLHGYFVFQYLRLGLLLVSLAAWFLSQYEHFSIPGNYVEVASLGSASLIAGFALLEALKQPIAQWNGMEILVYFAELVAAVHIGGNLPRVSFERQYFDRYGQLLLVFMAAQEALGLLSLYNIARASSAGQSQQPEHSEPSNGHAAGNAPPTATNSQPLLQSFNSHSSVPPLSFSSTVPSSSFSTQSPEPYYSLAPSPYDGAFSKDHSFSLNTLKGHESDASDFYDCDSDTETTVTTATTATNNTIRNIRYGQAASEALFSPKRSELGPGIGGLSLDDGPSSRRVTRSQTKRQRGDGLRRFPTRGLK